jgi:hypothetical protein
MTKAVLSILRQATEPMTTHDIALEMLVTRALDKDDQKLLALMTKRVELRCGYSDSIVWSARQAGQGSSRFGRSRASYGATVLPAPFRSPIVPYAARW